MAILGPTWTKLVPITLLLSERSLSSEERKIFTIKPSPDRYGPSSSPSKMLRSSQTQNLSAPKSRLVTGKAHGGTSRKFGWGGGGVWAEVSGGPDFLEVALLWKFPYGKLPKQTSKKFASEPPKLLKSPSRSGSMRKLVLALSYPKHLSRLKITSKVSFRLILKVLQKYPLKHEITIKALLKL